MNYISAYINAVQKSDNCMLEAIIARTAGRPPFFAGLVAALSLHLGHAPLDLLGRDVLDMGRDVPMVPERVLEAPERSP